MIATLQPAPLDQWRQRFGGRRRRNRRPRPLAGLGYLAHGPVVEGLVEIEKLLLVVLYDAPRRPWATCRAIGRVLRRPRSLGRQVGRGRTVPVPQEPLAPARAQRAGAAAQHGQHRSAAAGAATGPRIGQARSAARRCPCGNSFVCPASGPDSSRPTQPRSPATGRNWRRIAVAPASPPGGCWTGFGANTSAFRSTRSPG